MAGHQLYLSLGDNRWVTAWCGCGDWRQERLLKVGRQAAELVRELEEEFERHAGFDAPAPYTPALPTA